MREGGGGCGIWVDFGVWVWDFVGSALLCFALYCTVYTAFWVWSYSCALLCVALHGGMAGLGCSFCFFQFVWVFGLGFGWVGFGFFSLFFSSSFFLLYLSLLLFFSFCFFDSGDGGCFELKRALNGAYLFFSRVFDSGNYQ